MHHELKCHPPYFEATITGNKPFEIRKNDRNYHAGDTVTLYEFDPNPKTAKSEHYTGRAYNAVINYVTTFAQKPGFVVFSLAPTS